MTDREKLAPFLPAVRQAHEESGLAKSMPGFDLAMFCSQGFRESGFTWAKGYTPQGDPKGTGDFGHGHGIFQIDDRTWGDWLAKNHWWEPLTNARKACDILRQDIAYLKILNTMPAVDAPLFMRTVVAAFNCGPGRARRGLAEGHPVGDPDKYTAAPHPGAPGNYSAWIVAKRADLIVQMPELLH